MIRIFLSYSHRDEGLREELEKHLAVLQRDGVIDIWQDRRIGPGDEFGSEISDKLETADIVLLLVSADFLHSDYCYEIEMKRALERHEEGATKVIPVILRPCDWHGAPFGLLNAIPADGKPIVEHTTLDRGFHDVARTIRSVVEKMVVVQPEKDVHFGEIEPRDSPDRSSNLRIKKQFSDRERHEFLEEGFEYIADYFENSLGELKIRSSDVEVKFKRIDTNRFEAAAYVGGAQKSGCGIWLDGRSRDGSICFSYDGVGSGNSYNESMSIGDNGYTLFFTPMGMSRYGQNRNDELTYEGAGEYYWSLFVDQLR